VNEVTLPGAFELLRLLFLQPAKLRPRLQDAGVEDATASCLSLWVGGEASRAYVKRMLRSLVSCILILCVTAPAAAIVLGLLLHSFRTVELVIALTFGAGIAGAAVSVASIIWCHRLGVVLLTAGGIILDIVWSIGFSVALALEEPALFVLFIILGPAPAAAAGILLARAVKRGQKNAGP
jgi:hypothetical protein